MSTPGPWHTEIDYVSAQRKTRTGYTNIRNNADVFVCKVFGEEDARLIAAAPELLEALKDLQKVVRDEYHLLDVKKRYSLCVADMIAGKAIAKAEGREP